MMQPQECAYDVLDMRELEMRMRDIARKKRTPRSGHMYDEMLMAKSDYIAHRVNVAGTA